MPRRVVIGFYGHTPKSAKKAGKVEYQYLSNWSRCIFELEDHTFYASEQYLMWKKAQLFGDKKIAKLIMKEVTQEDLECDDKTWSAKMGKIKEFGRKVTKFDKEKWEEERQEIMITGLYAKFSQDDGLKEILLATGHCTLAECAPRDCIWGIGLGVTNPKVQDVTKWRGLNLLGNCLMKVRRRLRHEI